MRLTNKDEKSHDTNKRENGRILCSRRPLKISNFDGSIAFFPHIKCYRYNNIHTVGIAQLCIDKKRKKKKNTKI